MPSRSQALRALRSAALALALCLVAACSHLHWPRHRALPPPPVAVHELDVTGAGAAGLPQYWKRNTLLVDLSAVSGTGTITVKPVAGTTWPIRLAFRVTPGAIAVLEVRGAERVSLPINPTGARPVDLELTPGVYTAKTAQLTVSWGPADVPAP